MANVVLENLEKIYSNGFKAVHGINLDIKDGEFMVFVGPSGCAKSTTLRMIAGLEEISSGKILIGEQVVNDLQPKDRGIAMVFQNYALYPHMTCYENMAFGLKLKKIPKNEIDVRVKDAAEKLEITDLLDRKPKDMSGGQRQRVAVGRAIVRKPEVFLFDEPLSNLDAKLRGAMRVKIKQLHKDLKEAGQSSTMIYVTHDQVEAMTMGDRICVLEKGVIKQIETPINLYKNPQNKFVAGFIGSPAMNIKSAMLLNKNSEIVVEIGTHYLPLPPHIAEKVKNYVGKKIWFGIRPEHISSHEINKDKQNYVDGQITIVEQMGNERYVHFTIDDNDYSARFSSEKIKNVIIGEEYSFWFDIDKCHLFDYDTEENISL